MSVTWRDYNESRFCISDDDITSRYIGQLVNDEPEVTCIGSVFQMGAPATGKAREPMEVRRTAGTIRSSEDVIVTWRAISTNCLPNPSWSKQTWSTGVRQAMVETVRHVTITSPAHQIRKPWRKLHRVILIQTTTQQRLYGIRRKKEKEMKMSRQRLNPD